MLFRRKQTAERLLRDVPREAYPRHIAIIMDGNGRWAERRGLPRRAGHAAGSEVFRNIAVYCNDIGIKYLTVYAFSTENWSRPTDEVAVIMELLRRYLDESIEKLKRENIGLKVWGGLDRLPPDIVLRIEQADRLSEGHTGLQANICLNYGGRDDLVEAMRRMAGQGLRPDEIDEAVLADNLCSAGVPDPDLLIRPGGEYRLSNFLLYQSAYTELYFTDIMWPDFNERELARAIAAYAARVRRYGGIDGPSG